MIAPYIDVLRQEGSLTFVTELVEVSGGKRREAEKEAEKRLIAYAFHDAPELLHTLDGAPYLSNKPTPVSISHGAGRCVLAVSTDLRPIGVDIECWREQLYRVSRKFLTTDELPRYVDSQESLLTVWAAKEGVFKAAGMPGLVISRISVDLDTKTAIVADGRSFSLEIYGDFPIKLVVARPV